MFYLDSSRECRAPMSKRESNLRIAARLKAQHTLQEAPKPESLACLVVPRSKELAVLRVEVRCHISRVDTVVPVIYNKQRAIMRCYIPSC